MNYVAQNYSDVSLTVTFSDGYQLTVPPRKLVSSLDDNASGIMTSSFGQAYNGGSVDLSVNLVAGNPDAIVWMDGSEKLGISNSAPYTFKATNLKPGKHDFYARIVDNDKCYCQCFRRCCYRLDQYW